MESVKVGMFFNVGKLKVKENAIYKISPTILYIFINHVFVIAIPILSGEAISFDSTLPRMRLLRTSPAFRRQAMTTVLNIIYIAFRNKLTLSMPGIFYVTASVKVFFAPVGFII
ncbi:MAG: hypothetical protein EOO98_13595 [Pedobacter sp.]|nr:MAG: hypothetical protein EOO98_13595 [Pedobacter sp.]